MPKPCSKVKAIFSALLLLVIGVLIGRLLLPAPPTPAPPATPASPASLASPHAHGAVQQYTCPMHPTVRLGDPEARCPICFMALVPLDSDDSDDADKRDTRDLLKLSPSAAALAGITVAPVQTGPAIRSLRLQGRLEYDETAMADITAWVDGRIDRLFADYTGMKVRKGDHMVRIYSPQLLSAQAELIQAAAALKKLDDSSGELLRESVSSNFQAAEEKLRLAGLADEQIRKILDSKTPEAFITINTPVGGVVTHRFVSEGQYVKTGAKLCSIADPRQLWLILDAYESDLPWLRMGNSVKFTLRAAPGEIFDGLIGFISPELNEDSHIARVRVSVKTDNESLRPGMLALASIEAMLDSSGQPVSDVNYAGQYICPMHPSVRSSAPGDKCSICEMALEPAEKLGFAGQGSSAVELTLVPESAVLRTGKRDIVYVRMPQKPDEQGNGKLSYELREVTLGAKSASRYVVLEGLAPGELVVVNGAFKIDSERQLRGKPSMVSGMSTRSTHESDSASHEGHRHE